MMVSLDMVAIIILAGVCILMLGQIGKHKKQLQYLAVALNSQSEALKAMAETIYGKAMMEQYVTERSDETTH